MLLKVGVPDWNTSNVTQCTTEMHTTSRVRQGNLAFLLTVLVGSCIKKRTFYLKEGHKKSRPKKDDHKQNRQLQQLENLVHNEPTDVAEVSIFW
jgi:hypothetical protein